MQGGALFNPGFLGGNFLWWVGQVVDDKEWRDNVNQEKIKSTKDIKGWGYRYKIRIFFFLFFIYFIFNIFIINICC